MIKGSGYNLRTQFSNRQYMEHIIEFLLISLIRLLPIKKAYSLAWRYSEALVKKNKRLPRIGKTIYGFSIMGELNDYLFRSIYFKGIYEQEIFDVLDQLVNKDQVWYDLGSNIGYYSLYFAKKTKHALSVDANPELTKLLAEATKLNKFENVTIINRAISDQPDQKVEFFIAVEDLGRSSMLKYNDITNTKKIETTTITVDGIIAAGNPLPFGMKIDIEGLEIHALNGSKNLIQNHPPKIIVMELSQRKEVLARPEEIINFLKQYNYTAYLIRGKKLRPISLKDKLDALIDPNVFFLHASYKTQVCES